MYRLPPLSRRSLLTATVLMAVTPAFASSRAKYKNPALPTATRVRDLLSVMTLEEKAAQMRCLWFGKAAIMDADSNFSDEKAGHILSNGIGQIARPSDTAGTASFQKNGTRTLESTVAFVNAVQKFLTENTRLGIPALFHEETAHGYAAPGATAFPIPPGLASTWDTDLIEQVYTVAGREARLRGATIGLSPVLDLARDPRYGRVEEFFSEDPYLTAQMGIAAARGQQGPSRPLANDKVFVVLKHFVHAIPEGGLNLAPADISERTLRSTYLVPFEAVIHAVNPAIIMPSYNEVEGVPSHASRELLERTGRQRLGFKGAYFSDYNGITNLQSQHHVAADADGAAILALRAGVDAELPDGKAYARLPDLVRAGQVSEAQLDAAVARILSLKFEAGLFENPYVDAQRAIAGTNTPADIQLARLTAQKSLVLLKNDGILPLATDKPVKLAVIGPNAKEPMFGGYAGTNDKAVSILDGLKALATETLSIEYAEGTRIVDVVPGTAHRNVAPMHIADPAQNAALVKAAIEVAGRADVVVLVVGDTPETTREAVMVNAPGDRSTLGLFGEQDALVEAMLATGKPVIALLLNGRPLAVNRLAEKANALLEGWYLGQEGGNAFADVLFGKVNPGGKLAVSFPRSVGELPVYYNRHPSSDIFGYIEGQRTALFPFGFGLSYSRFVVSEPRLLKPIIRVGETATVEVDVTNVGDRAGDEVVQLYIRDDVSSAPRPVLELKGFQRVTLKHGETRTLTFNLSPDCLAFWDIDMQWRVEPGTFTLSAGNSSTSLKTARLTVVA